MSQKNISGRLAQWSLKLQAFDYNVVHRKGTQNAVPNELSRIDIAELFTTQLSFDVGLRSLDKTITEKQEQFTALCVSGKVVFKRTKICSCDLREKSYKPGMVNEVKLLIRSCATCLCAKCTTKMKHPIMSKQVISEKPFQRLYIFEQQTGIHLTLGRENNK